MLFPGKYTLRLLLQKHATCLYHVQRSDIILHRKHLAKSPVCRGKHVARCIRARVGCPRGNGNRCDVVGFSCARDGLLYSTGVCFSWSWSETDRQPVYDIQRARTSTPCAVIYAVSRNCWKKNLFFSKEKRVVENTRCSIYAWDFVI